MLSFAFSHVEYATVDEIGEDSLVWMAGLVGIPNWPAGKEFAIVCVTTADGPVGYFTEDVEYARMLKRSQEVDLPLEISDEVAKARFPYNRAGWPGDWIGLNQPTEQ